MASKIDLQYIYQNIDSNAEFQLVVEELTNVSGLPTLDFYTQEQTSLFDF